MDMMHSSLFIISFNGGNESAMKRKVIGLAISSIVVVVLFFLIQRLVVPKYADKPLEGNFTAEYYKEKSDHEVMLIGDCEVYENINPIEMWKKYGITSYIRGNAQQLTWQSYYMLEDALKYETPKVVVYNVQALTHGEPQREEYNRMTLDGMRWSKTKYNAIRASMCREENMLDYLLPLFRYHSRILDLSKNDIKYYWKSKKVTHNGYYMRIDVLPVSESDVADPSWLFGDQSKEEEDILDPWTDIEKADDDLEQSPTIRDSESGEREKIGKYPIKYLDKIRKLCEDNGIKLVLMKAPSISPEWYDSYNKQVVKYAKKNGLPYINFYELIDTIKIDYEKDTYDGGLHMNLYGANKLSDYLGEWLVEKYALKDYRNDKKISQIYDEKIRFYEDMKKEQQNEIKKYGKVVSY